MARYEHLPIYKAALDLTVHFEKLVEGISRYHQYTLGTELREGSGNYLMSIDKPRLFEMVAARLNARRPADEEALWLAEKLVSHDCTREPVLKGDPRLVDRLPAHKTLFRAPPGKDLPIGNLNSQFFPTSSRPRGGGPVGDVRGPAR